MKKKNIDHSLLSNTQKCQPHIESNIEDFQYVQANSAHKIQQKWWPSQDLSNYL